jgi:uncharacterized protein YeaC (DUF1315 family)
MSLPDDLNNLLDALTPEVYDALKTAVELGKWPQGERLTPEQRELCLQAVIYYDCRHKPEQERVGYIHRESHTHCESEGDAEHDHAANKWDETQLLVLRDLLDTHNTSHH